MSFWELKDKVIFLAVLFFSAVAFAQNAENAASVTTTPQEKYWVFRASSDKIRMLETSADIFSSSQLQNKKHILTDIARGELQRRFYDEYFRLLKVEYWKIASSSTKSKMERILNYTFGSNGRVASIKENDFGAQSASLTYFYPSGKIRSQRKDKYKKGEIVSFEIFTYEYDNKNRLLREKRQLFEMQNSRETLVLSQNTTNKYSEQNLLETAFYESSTLRLRKVFRDGNSENYIQTTYFDGGYTVRDFYENGERVASSISNRERGEIK